MSKLLLSKTDIVFQNLFGRIGNEEITKRLLSLIMQKEIKELNLDVSNRLERNNIQEKLGLLDVRAKLKNGEDFNIEMQIKDNKDMGQRMLYYWSKLYGRKLEKSQEYKKLMPTISILITEYALKETKGIKRYHTIWNLREKTQNTRIITKDIELHIIELAKIKQEEIGQDPLATWLLFIKEPENERVMKMIEEDEVLQQAMQELQHLSGSPNFKRLVELREKAIRDEVSEKAQAKREGRKEGRKEGKLEESRHIAKKMLQKQVELTFITEVTGLKRRELETLK